MNLLAVEFMNQVLRGGGWVLLGLFVPGLLFTTVLIKNKRGELRIEAIRDLYTLTPNTYYRIYAASRSAAFTRKHLFPVLVIVALCLFFATLLIYTPEMQGCLTPHIFVLGGEYAKPSEAASEHIKATLIAISYAYLGWYAWAVSTLFSRLVTMEFVPGTLYAVLSRLVLAIIVAAVLRQIAGLVGLSTLADRPEAIGFATGLFPSTVLRFLSDFFKKLFTSSNQTGEMPLDMIQGISSYCMFRLYDVGIDDCEDLAAANPIELFEATNLPLLELIDWVGQAQLAVLLQPDRFKRLRAEGFRTSLDFVRAGTDPQTKPAVLGIIGWPANHLDGVLAGMRDDPNYQRLLDLHTRILAVH